MGRIERNFWKTGGFSLFTDNYVYIDHKDYLADPLLAQEAVRMKIENEMIKENSPYHVIFCKVRKKDARRFEKALGRLGNKMLLFGHLDYPLVCEEISKLLEENFRNRRETV